MDDFTSDSSTDTGWTTASAWADLYVPPMPTAKTYDRRRRALATSALPGVAITDDVVEDEQNRRVLMRVVTRLAAAGEISRTTYHTVDAFIEALPRNKRLPKIVPDGEGGLTMAWTVPGQHRTLITLADWTLYAVARAGSPDVEYLPDTPFEGIIADEVLAVIPE